jgi:hypothetical protein
VFVEIFNVGVMGFPVGVPSPVEKTIRLDLNQPLRS